MIFTILTRPRRQPMRLAGYCSLSSVAVLRVVVGCVMLISVAMMQSCATQEMKTADKAAVPSSNAAEGQPAQQDDAADVADSAPETFSFERMYRDRYKTTPDEQE